MKRRILSIITALALVLSLCPAGALAAGEPADAGLCDHHPAHTAECGYAAPDGGQPCGHEHGDECYSEETRCVHVHGESCYSDGLLPAEGEDKAADACAHVCSAESGCVTRTLECRHSHDGACGYIAPADGVPCGYVCRVCPVENLIAALPDTATEDSADEVRARLDEILALYRELDGDEQGQISLSRCTALREQLDALAGQPEANEPEETAAETTGTVDYLTWDDERGELVSASYTGAYSTVEPGSTAWSAGWYVAEGSVEINKRVTVSGDVHLILKDGCALTASNGITVAGRDSLTIYAQSETGSAGALTAGQPSSHTDSGIGGRYEQSGGTITINGGSITAIGGEFCTGIGGGYLSSGGNVTVNGGSVIATGGAHSAGIGGSGGDGGMITIRGGEVTATGGNFAAGIGGGNSGSGGTITITGGTVTATGGGTEQGGGAGIGGGVKSSGGTITITGGTVTATGSTNSDGIGSGQGGGSGQITITGGTITAAGSGSGSPVHPDGVVSGGELNDTLYYKVTFVPGKENVTAAAQGVAQGGRASAPAVHGQAEGFKLSGWSLTEGGTEPFDFENTEIRGDLTLYGIWEVDTDYLAEVTINGAVTSFTTVHAAWASLQGKTGTFRLLRSTTMSAALVADSGMDVTVEMDDEVSLTNNSADCFQVWGGRLTLASGIAVENRSRSSVVYANSGVLRVTGGTYRSTSGNGFWVDSGVDVKFSGGTIEASGTLLRYESKTAKAMLAEGYSIYGSDDTPIDAVGLKVEKLNRTDGPYTVRPCTHRFGEDGVCTICGKPKAVAAVTVNGVTTRYDDLESAWEGAQRAGTATVTLLADVELSQAITISGSQFTLSGGGHTITYTGGGAAIRIASGTVTLSDCKIDGKQYGVEVSDGTVKLSGCAITAAGDGYSGGQGVYILGGDVTISGGTYSGTGGDAACGVEIHGGMLTIESGTFSGAGGYNACGVKVADSGKAAIRDGSFSGTDGYAASGLCVLFGGNAVISGGVFTGSYYGVYNTGGTTISGGTFSGEWYPLDTNASLAGMLATGCACYRDDKPIEADNGLSPGTVTVRECGHTGVEVKDLGSGKHGLDCPYCGGGYSHETVLTAAASGSLVTLTLGCRTGDCGYKESLGSMTFTIPSVFYGETGKELTWTPVPGDYYLALELTGSQAQILPPTKTSITMGELFGSTKMTPGSYQLQVGCFYSGHMEACKLPITVEKAPLTPSITGTATKPYDGTTAAPEGLEIALTGLVEGDDVTASASFAYNSENVNEANAITATNITLGGADAGNYRLTSDSASIEGTITKANQAAPAAPAAAEDNIKDTSITLNTIANAEYSKDGDTWQASPTFTGLDPNRAYTFYARLKGDGNHNASTNSPGASITTRKMMLDNATVTVGGSYTYTGAAQTPAVAVVKNGKTLTAGTDYTVSYANNTNAGTATVTITGMGDYEGTNSTTFTIRQKPLTATGAAAQNRAYDGTNTVTITGVMLEGVVDGDQVSVSTAGLTGTLGGTDAGAYTAVTLPAMALTGAAKDNYTLTRPAGAVSTSVTISKADALTPKTGDLAVANGRAHTYTYGLGALRPDAPEGMRLGSSAVTYTLGAVSLGSYYGGSGAKIAGQTLTLPIEAVGNDKAQGIGTITVIIHTGNFEDMTATINVRSVNKIIPEGAPALSADVLTYGQSLDTIMLSGAMRDGEKTVPGTFAWSSPGNRPAVQEAYAAAWVFTPDDNDTYAIVNGTSVIRVAPASIAGAVITLAPSVFRYDGQPHSPNISSVRLGGVTLTAGADYTAGVPAETEAGTYTVTVTGRGNYTGTAAAAFTINPVAQKPLDQKDDSGRDLRLEVETGLSAVPDALKTNPKYDTPEKIEEELRTRVRAVMTGAGENIAVFDVTLQYKDAGGVWHDVDPNDFPAEGVTAILPYPDGTGMTGWRFTVQHLISSGGDAGEMETLAHTLTADGLQCTFTSLSPVAIGYQAASNPTPQPVPGGGSDDRDDTCAVTVERPVHGKVTASPGSAGRGDTVTLTVTPDSGYVLDTLTVTDRRGNEIGLTARDGGKYAFTMPGRAVTVRAVFVPVQAGWSNPYSDVAPDAWCYEAVRFVTENGLMSGYGNGGSPAGGVFGPNRILTRAQFAQILHNREGRPAVNYLMRFEDVPGGAWCAEAIRWAASQGIVGGYGNGRFGPNDGITREQLAVMLWRYAGSPAAAGGELHFSDAGKIGAHARDAMCWAVENGVMSGRGGGVLDPKGLATRAQTAQMLKNSFSK